MDVASVGLLILLNCFFSSVRIYQSNPEGEEHDDIEIYDASNPWNDEAHHQIVM
jgi:hypothetical protein